MDQSRLVGGLGLAPQVTDVDLQRIGGSGEVEAPHLVEQPAALEDSPRVSQERFQEGELGPGQVDRPRSAQHLARLSVQDQIGELQTARRGVGRIRDRPGAADQRPEPGQEFVQGEGLGEVVVGPSVEPVNPVTDRIPGSQHQDRHVVPCRPKTPGRLQTVETRHHHIHNHSVGSQHGESGQRLHTVVCRADLVTGVLERSLERVPDSLIIVDDQDVLHAPKIARRCQGASRSSELISGAPWLPGFGGFGEGCRT